MFDKNRQEKSCLVVVLRCGSYGVDTISISTRENTFLYTEFTLLQE